MPFEVSLCFICLSLNTAGLLGQARQLSSLTVGLSMHYTASLVSWVTLVPTERTDVFFLFFFLLLSAEDLLSSPVLLSPCLCYFALRCVGEILDYGNHSNQCLLFNVEFPEDPLTLISSHDFVKTHIYG